MASFYEGLERGAADEIERLSRLMFELRNNRDQLLATWKVREADALLERIRAGEVDEHPAYEAWLSLRILDDTRLATRTLLDERLWEMSLR